MSARDTICAVATAAGAGAVGIVRVSGPAARELLEAVTRLRDVKPRAMCATVIRDPRSGERIDHALVCLMPGPRSYTGEDVLEVFGHGGPLNMGRLLGLFTALGARQAEPGEFTRRAFVNGRMDLTQVEAVAEIIEARGERALRNAHAVLGGQLGRRVRALRAKTVTLAADLEACLDFAEDVDTPVSTEGMGRAHAEVIEGLGKLAASYQHGQRLNGVSVALVGPVNAGKSSLFNALLGNERALVSAQPGTTRDYLEAVLDWDGLAVTLVDTAGQREVHCMSELERAGVVLGSERVQRCDLVIHVVDLTSLSRIQVDTGFAQRWGVPIVVAANKVDSVSAETVEHAREVFAGVNAVVATSAVEALGVEALKRAAARALLPEDESGTLETVQVTQLRQHNALLRAKAELETGRCALADDTAPELVVEHTRAALGALGEITGETFTEDVLGSIFSRFCVGK